MSWKASIVQWGKSLSQRLKSFLLEQFFPPFFQPCTYIGIQCYPSLWSLTSERSDNVKHEYTHSNSSPVQQAEIGPTWPARGRVATGRTDSRGGHRAQARKFASVHEGTRWSRLASKESRCPSGFFLFFLSLLSPCPDNSSSFHLLKIPFL